MARTLATISELDNSMPVEEIKVLSFSEELEKVQKVKFALSFSYFVGLIAITTTLFL